MNHLSFAKAVALETGALVRKYFKKGVDIRWKSKNDVVTVADKAAEDLIIAHIRKNFPTHSVLGEESGASDALSRADSKSASAYRWIIDPIDGTKNFAHGIPLCAVSVALEVDGERRLGAVYLPILDELFYAEKGKGAFMNRKRIHVSKKTKLIEAVTCTGFVPSRSSQEFKKGLTSFNTLTKKTGAVRRLGSAATDMAYVACGRLDAFWEYGLHIWDVAAGEVLIQEAGGRVSNISGSSSALIVDPKTHMVDILATNGNIHKQMIKNLP